MQYKVAMDRMTRLNCVGRDPQVLDLPDAESGHPSNSVLLPRVEIGVDEEIVVEDNSRSPLALQVAAAVKVMVPVKIILLLAKILFLIFFLDDFSRLLDVWYMPFLGVIAACLANCVPIGGGIVYVPALALLGPGLKLGVSFSVATMTVGNGVFGYYHWQQKDNSLLVWEAIPYTVIPSSIGTLASLLVDSPSEEVVKLYFALFCFLLAVFVLFSVHKGGITEVVNDIRSWQGGVPEGIMCPKSAKAPGGAGGCELDGLNSAPLGRGWLFLALISFLAGLVLVPNIAIGPSLITFLGLVLLGFQEQRAMVTGIVVGGWASIMPFLLHIGVYQDVPWILWLMVLPGVALGAWLAPKIQSLIGVENSLVAFGAFLLCTFALFMTQ